MTQINLGDEVKDKVTGFRGVVIAITSWLYGCRRVTVQPPMGKDGKVPEGMVFDEPSVNIVKSGKIRPGSNHTGGSQNDKLALKRN